jgi:signal transduction histidine kinase/CheY-like chemotaxis protein
MRQTKTTPPKSPSSLMLEDMPIAMALVDADHAVLETNHAFRSLLGHAADPVGMSLREALQSATVVTDDGDFGKVYCIPRDGIEASYRLTTHGYRGGSIAILSDVTAARDKADRRRVSEDVRARLMHDAEIGAWRYDPDAEIYYFPTELSLGHGDIGRPLPLATLRLLQHHDDQAKDDAIRERITRQGGAAEGEMRYRAADGGWTHLRVLYRAGARLPSGLYEMYGLSLSITALASARDEANAIAQRLNLALKASRAGVFEYDYDKHTFWLSSEFAALVGPEALAKTAEDPFAFFHPQDRRAVIALRQRAAASSGAEPADVRVIRPEGPYWVRLYLEVERGANGKPARGVGLMIDIDEAKRQEIAISEARRVAESATAAKSDFLASVSHEIRTPMNGIVGVLNLLRREGLSGEGRQLLDEALGCTGMLSQLINDVLDFSKIEAGKLSLDPAPSDAAAITESVISLIRPQAEAKGLALATQVDEAIGWSMIDPVRLRQCLFNVIGNAVKFTERGGVEVRLSRVGDGEARKLRCEVEDTGIGVPADARERLFDRFQQGEGGSARRFGGTGLGLAISRQLARLMGGDLDYESRESVGSTFWFEIAAPACPAPEAEVAMHGDAAPLAGLTVLVVDDNRVNRVVGVKSLEALGAAAEAVESGPAAIEAVRQGRFDLVLMDVNMPGMDGLEATRRIRALAEPCAGVPILALTADVMRHQQRSYLAAGMNGMVPKPFSPAQLLSEVMRLAGTAEAPERQTA